MTQTTIEGAGAQRRDLSAWFTPADLAERIVEWALQPFGELTSRGLDILEPSAGRGALVRPLLARSLRVDALDIDPDNVRALRVTFGERKPGFCASEVDFLTLEPGRMQPGYDLAIMNPPFEGGAAEAHIMHALKFADHAVAHVPLTTLEGKARRESLWSKVRLHRLAVCATRPKYGAKGGATAMCTLDVSARTVVIGKPAAWDGVDVEVWP